MKNTEQPKTFIRLMSQKEFIGFITGNDILGADSIFNGIHFASVGYQEDHDEIIRVLKNNLQTGNHDICVVCEGGVSFTKHILAKKGVAYWHCDSYDGEYILSEIVVNRYDISMFKRVVVKNTWTGVTLAEFDACDILDIVYHHDCGAQLGDELKNKIVNLMHDVASTIVL